MDSGDVFHFGEFRLETSERRLTQEGKVVRLSPKAHDVLVVLLRQAGRLVTKDELLSQVWPDAIVEEGILTVHISALRKALGDDKRSNGYIETVSRSGYRFVAPVTREQSDRRHGSACVPSRDRWSSTSSWVVDAPACFRGPTSRYPTRCPRFGRRSSSIRPTRRHTQGWRWRAVSRAASEPHRTRRPLPRRSRRPCARWRWTASARMPRWRWAWCCRGQWDWAAAERSLRRALEINPSHTEALLAYGSLMEALGRPEEGLRFKEQALARSPESWLVFAEIANSCWNQRRYDDAIRWAKRVLEIDPRNLLAGEFLCAAYLKRGDVDQFLAENLRRAALFGVPEEALEQLTRQAADLRQAYATEGHAGLARCMLAQSRRTPEGRSRSSARCSTVPPASSMRHSNTWTGRSICAIRRSCTSPSRRSGTACAMIHGSPID